MRGDFSADFEALQRDIGFYGAVECMGHELQYKKNVKLCPSPVGSHITSYPSVQLVRSHIVQCPDSQVSWDHSYR